MSCPKRGSHPSRQKRFGPAPLASFEDLPTDDQDSSPESNEPAARIGKHATLRLELEPHHPAAPAPGSELSTPLVESDVISQITITPTADSRNVSPLQPVQPMDLINPTRSSLTTSVTEESSYKDEDDVEDQVGAAVDCGVASGCKRVEVMPSVAVSDVDKTHMAITSEALLESLLKFEEERIPLSARLERSCQSIADIPSASHSRKNSSVQIIKQTSVSDGESEIDLGEPEDEDSVGHLASSQRKREKLRKQTSEDRVERQTLLPSQDSIDAEYEISELQDKNQVLPAESVEVHTPRTPHKHQRPQLVTIPIERPRSTTPINVAPFEAFVQQQGDHCASTHSLAKSPDKLKLTLPGTNLVKSPRKGSLRNWEDFCEEALQASPRARSKSDAAAQQCFFPDPEEFSPISPPPPNEDDIQSPSDYADPFRRRYTCSCRCRVCACLCGGCDCDCHFYATKILESHLSDPMSKIEEINGAPNDQSPKEDEQTLLSPEEDPVSVTSCTCDCHSLPRDTSCLLTAPLLVAQSSVDSC